MLKEEYREVALRTVELNETVLEALEHTKKLINEGQFEQSVYIFEEAMKGYAQVELVLKPSDSEVVQVSLNQVVDKANQIVEAYSDQKFEKVKELLRLSMIPAFKRLQVSVSEEYKEYLTQ
ncbi:hypothetical protein KP77_27030 [Jeotgalibacillus alimentarius]|uniref:DUF8042 domain-containing protein n=1 Tax=Jeotgalibacillus alimentarius TaxID=135826 RepID=A0A0C2VQ72_9BACL|nr:hypothetical protein [Jeotgalibacillus alimentarius]KIL46576.1 hypothetical protein KP77_27030 [Jeotgalibacillus alimentarius]